MSGAYANNCDLAHCNLTIPWQTEHQMTAVCSAKLRHSRFRAAAFAALAGCCTFAASGAAQAALGGRYASIAADQAQLHASIKMTAHSAYEVHELTLASGTTVREYVAASGIVFAVAWTGPSLPNLQQTLGTYFADYRSAAQSRRGGRNHLSLERSDLSIEAGGHMRAFFGRAVLVQAVPAGVSSNELR